MGVKVAVVGAGSTYTPELVEGFVTRGDRLPVDELTSCSTSTRSASASSVRSPNGMMRRAGWGGTLRLTGDKREAIEGADFVIVQLRVGGNKARYTDETIPLEFDCIGQETTGAGRVRQGAADRAGRARSGRADPGDRRAGRMVRRLHEPDRPRHPGAPGSRPSRAGPVQRGDRVPAGVREAFRRRARAGPARARRPQPPDVGTQGAGRRGGPAARAARRSAARAGPGRVRGHADRLHPRARRDPELLPALLLPNLRGARAPARRARPAPKR